MRKANDPSDVCNDEDELLEEKTLLLELRVCNFCFLGCATDPIVPPFRTITHCDVHYNLFERFEFEQMGFNRKRFVMVLYRLLAMPTEQWSACKLETCRLRAGHSGQFLLKAFRIMGISTRKILQIDT